MLHLVIQQGSCTPCNKCCGLIKTKSVKNTDKNVAKRSDQNTRKKKGGDSVDGEGGGRGVSDSGSGVGSGLESGYAVAAVVASYGFSGEGGNCGGGAACGG